MPPVDPTPRRVSRAVALVLVVGSLALGVLAFTFQSEASYLQGLLVEGSPVPGDVTVFATTGGVAMVVLVAGLLLATWLLLAPLRSLCVCAGAWSVLAAGATMWTLGRPAAQLEAYGSSAVPVPLDMVAIVMAVAACVGIGAAIVGWVVTPSRRTWLESVPAAGRLTMPPPTHQA